LILGKGKKENWGGGGDRYGGERNARQDTSGTRKKLKKEEN